MTIRQTTRTGLAGVAVLILAASAHGAATIKELKREFEGRERTVVVMENDRILVEIVPSVAGRIVSYRDKSKRLSAFEWLDDCPYHYGCRWEGKPFTHQISETGPGKVSLKVEGGGRIAVAQLRGVLGLDLAGALDLTCERTMAIDAKSTRLVVQIKITNTGDAVAPQFRYMMHGVWGQVPRQPFAFLLPTESGLQFFDGARARKEFAEAIHQTGKDPNHRFNRFVPGRRADKPRYVPAGWVALLTSAGPTYVYYPREQYDFFQYWYGGDSQWHWTSEPQSKAVDLAPGQSVEIRFTLAYDASEVPFNTKTVAVLPPELPQTVTRGFTLPIQSQATTARNTSEQAQFTFVIKSPDGRTVFEETAAKAVKGFAFESLDLAYAVPEDAPLGKYSWRAVLPDGKTLAQGAFEVLTPEEFSKRKTEAAIARTKADYERKLKDLSEKHRGATRLAGGWRRGMEFALSMRDPEGWDVPAEPVAAVSVRRLKDAVPVIGRWKEREPPRIQRYAPAELRPWPAEAAAGLAKLGSDQAHVRDLAVTPDGKLVVLVVDPAGKRVQVVRVGPGGVEHRFGRYADQPAEDDDRLGDQARALAVDDGGNVWVATNVWGVTSVYVPGPTGQPSEETRPGVKGAVKKFDAGGKLLGSVSLLDPPITSSHKFCP